jgi:hypothetical protein
MSASDFQRGNDNLLGGDGDDWLIGDWAKQVAAYDSDLPVITEAFRILYVDGAPLPAPGPFGSLMMAPNRAYPNEVDELQAFSRAFTSTTGNTMLPGILKDLNTFPRVCPG